MPQRYRRTPYVPAKDPLTGIPPSRHPFQVWAMLALTVAGGANLAGLSTSTVVQSLLPESFLLAWSLLMFLSGGLALIAAFWPDRITGLLLERLSLSAVSLVLIVYGVVVMYVAGRTGSVATTLSLALGVAAGWRCLHITRELEVLRRFIAWHYDDQVGSP